MGDERDLLAGVDEDILCADGFDEAIIGYVEQIGRPAIALYDRKKCIEILMSEGMTEEDALEHFEFNVIGSYVGEYTPAFATLFNEEFDEPFNVHSSKKPPYADLDD